MTSVLLIFEITQNYAVIVPLMISNLVSFFVSARLQRHPIYECLAVQDGIHLPSAESRQRPQRQVLRIMRQSTASLAAEITARDAWEQLRSADFQTGLVVDRRGVGGRDERCATGKIGRASCRERV